MSSDLAKCPLGEKSPRKAAGLGYSSSNLGAHRNPPQACWPPAFLTQRVCGGLILCMSNQVLLMLPTRWPPHLGSPEQALSHGPGLCPDVFCVCVSLGVLTPSPPSGLGPGHRRRPVSPPDKAQVAAPPPAPGQPDPTGLFRQASGVHGYLAAGSFPPCGLAPLGQEPGMHVTHKRLPWPFGE